MALMRIQPEHTRPPFNEDRQQLGHKWQACKIWDGRRSADGGELIYNVLDEPVGVLVAERGDRAAGRG